MYLRHSGKDTYDDTEVLKHESIESFQYKGLSKNSEDTSSPGKKKPENLEITLSSTEKEHLDLKSFELSRDKKTRHRETVLFSRDNEKAYDTPKITLLYSVEKGECEIPVTITYLRDGQRYEKPDDSLCLSEGEYQESVGCFEDAETTVKEEDYDDSAYIVYSGEEHCLSIQKPQASLMKNTVIRI
ncbi:Caspase recruitment domain-containing protein 6 [Heterocephalus glaber]|uniref:Caspase recruitment domain-containing protein 6 n=1 Tax=Heterocephalus glaber TaxID=10181 RepID=G5C4R5_HETGA|nr:Caspase recruitment domain-containing protein 6 [Heterocephalus glaber]